MGLSKQAALQLIEKYITEFDNAKGLPVSDPNPRYEGAFHGASMLLKELFGEEEADRFHARLLPSYSLIGSSGELEVVKHYFYNHVDTCVSVLRTYKDKVKYFMPVPGQVNRSIPMITDNIFIIHGHDAENLWRLEKLLRESYKLKPIVLSEVSQKGRTLIEKFESEASNVGFAFAVMTSDDIVQTSAGEYVQARPNVVFEIGWFYGRLGRERVCILFKEGTTIHSDLAGIVGIPFNTSVEEKIVEVERELYAAGLI